MSKECTNSRIAQHRKELKTEIVRMHLGLPQCNTSQICITYLLLIVKEKQKKQRKGKKLQKGTALTKIGLVCFVDEVCKHKHLFMVGRLM